ncbi:hypothetical protein D1007_60652 [Hordeum vulgare]|nr:hypothetical protein D1007_60652 [Hordeum vulgare]
MTCMLLERALEASGDDLDDAIKSLKELHLMESNQANQSATGSTFEMSRQQSSHLLKVRVLNSKQITCVDPFVSYELMEYTLHCIVASSGVDTTTKHQPGADSHQVSNTRPKCVDLFVRETSNVSEMDDARAHVSRALEALMKSILEGAGAEAAQSLHQNAVLKRAVEIQDERQKEFDERSHEVQGLKHLVVQYQEELRTLEVTTSRVYLVLKCIPGLKVIERVYVVLNFRSLCIYILQNKRHCPNGKGAEISIGSNLFGL